MRVLASSSIVAALLLASAPLAAQCTASGFTVCAATGLQRNPRIMSDYAGGAIIVWEHSSMGLHAQRVDASGDGMWSGCGVPVIEGALCPWAAPDAAGGAVVVGVTLPGHTVVAQRIGGEGTLLWAPGGVPVAVSTGDCSYVRAVPDGAGGIVAIWPGGSGGSWDLFAQRIDADGSAMWTAGGVALGWSGNTSRIQISPDGTGGAFLVWSGDTGGTPDVYAQRIKGDGSITWQAGGVRVCSFDSGKALPNVANDGAGGAIVAWRDYRIPSNAIYAQRLGADGFPMWSQEGELVWIGDTQWAPEMASDGRGGAVIAWPGWAGGVHTVLAQRVSANGDLMWPADGVVTGAVLGLQPMPLAVVPDGRGGCIIGWMQYEGGATDIFAQRIAADGSLICGAGGMPVCTAAGDQIMPFGVSDGRGGAIVVWADAREDGGDIYGARIFGEDEAPAVFLDIRPGSCPNPFNPKSRGVLPAAILGTEDFDVREIDPASIVIEGVPPLRWSFEDVAALVAEASECACTEDGADGFLDLVLKFDVPAIAAVLGEVEAGQVIELSMSGALHDGTAIEGSDCIRIVGEGPKKDPKGRDRLNVAVVSSPRDMVQRLSYTLPEQSAVEIVVYDVAGRLVRRLESAVVSAGTHTLDWNTARLASGVYFCRLTADRNVLTKKMVLLR